jgi:hypothetical protein
MPIPASPIVAREPRPKNRWARLIVAKTAIMNAHRVPPPPAIGRCTKPPSTTSQNPPVANTTTAPAVMMSVVSQPMVVASLPFR